ncbi:hypothetical protein Ntsu_79350 [Nocardia sp. IFM 10818]
MAVGFACVQTGDSIIVPATALAEARAYIPADRRDVLAVLLDLPNTVVVDLDEPGGVAVGAVLAAAEEPRAALLSAAQVVVAAVGRDYPCLTDRGDRLRELDPRLVVDELP